MKKTLFLSAILATALCSSAFATTVDVTTNNQNLQTLAGAGDTININLTGDNTFLSGNSSGISYNILADVNITAAELTNGYSKTQYHFKGALTGSGTLSFTGRNPSGGYVSDDVFAFHNDASAFSGTLSINGSNKLQFINDTEGLETLVVGASSVVSTGSADDAFKTSGNVLFRGAATETEGVYSGTVSAAHTTIASGTTTIGSGVTASLGSLSMGDGAVLSVASGATLDMTSDSSYTVSSETARTSGNGFGTAILTKNFGTSLVNNGTITLNGAAATLADGTLTGTGNSTTYYVNEGDNISSLPGGATKLVVNSTSGGVNQLGLSNTTYGNLDIVINGGRVITAHNGGTGFTTGAVTVNAGGTLAVVESGGNALGWEDNATKSITLLGNETSKATFELSFSNTNYSLTLATDLNLNGHAQVSGSRSFNTNGGTITATGTDNIISAEMRLRTAASIVVNSGAELLISGAVSSASNDDETYSMTKTGAGVLTISGNISGTAAHIASITGDGANTIISSETISNATLTNVKLAKGSAQTINGTVTLDNATLTSELHVYNGGSLTLTGGVTDNGNSQFGIIVGTTGQTGTLTFESGTYDMSGHNHGIAVYTGSTMTLKSGATLTLTDIGFASAENQRGNNGTVTVNSGATLNITGSTVWNTYVGTMTANGTVTVADDLYTNAQLAVGGTYTQTAGTATVKTFLDLADNATVTLGNGSMEVQGTAGNQGIWFHSGSHIDLTGTGKLTADGMVISKGEGESSIKSTSSVAQIGSNDEGYNAALTFTNTNVEVTGNVLRNYTFDGGKVTVNSSTTTNINSALYDSTASTASTDLTVNSGSTANFTKANSSVNTLAGEGTVNVDENADLTVKAASTIKQLGGLGTVKALADLTVTSAKNDEVALGGLEIAGNTTVTVNDHAGTLTLKNLTVAGSGSVINANLAVSGGTMTMNSSVEMGCSVTLSNEALVLTNGVADGGVLQSYTLFTDVESLTLGTNENVAMGWYDVTADIIKSITVGTGATAITIAPANCVIGYWNGTVTISDKSVPEPATATLSLLALAALAARRRRH